MKVFFLRLWYFFKILLNQTNWVYGSVVNSLTDGFEQIDDILKAQQVDSTLHEIHKLTKDFEEVYDW